jgi:hypothetical protein
MGHRRGFALIGVLLASAFVAAGCAKDEVPPKDPPQTSAEPPTEYTSVGGVNLTVVTPRKGATVASPLEVAGRVPGSWSFEADFPIEIQDADRHQVADGHATVKGEWMTEDDVDFAGTIEFDPPETASGFLVLRKSNPSGQPEHEDQLEIPIRFEH